MREHVYGDLTPFGPEDIRRSSVEVTWSREAEHVQIATLSVDGVTGAVLPIGHATAETRQDGSDTPSIVVQTSYAIEGTYVQLDRQGINDLIRKLRRARDQAFGRDE